MNKSETPPSKIDHAILTPWRTLKPLYIEHPQSDSYRAAVIADAREDIRQKMESARRKKTRYMLDTPWYCKHCNYRKYCLATKTNHLRTKKHKRNAASMTV